MLPTGAYPRSAGGASGLRRRLVLADDPEVFFTTPHFDGYPAVLVRLDEINLEELEEVIIEAWLNRAPKRLAKEYLDSM